MKLNLLGWLVAAACILSTATAPKTAAAEDLIVQETQAAGRFLGIQAAIDEAAARVLRDPASPTSFRVIVEPGTYRGPITPISKVPIIGRRTAATFIEGGGSAPIISLNSVSDVTIRNFTFRNAPVGISVSNSPSIDIRNNVFQLGRSNGTAVSIQSSPGTLIVNNTFDNNETAINIGSSVTVTNNILSNNRNALSGQPSLAQLSFNDFFLNESNGVVNLGDRSIPNQLVLDANPRFVDQAGGDFHLKPDSPAKGRGNPNYPNPFDQPSDMGAYGGPFSDLTPPKVTGVKLSLTPPSTITITWNPAAAAGVTAYRVYYGPTGAFGGLAPEGNSPLTVPVGTTTSTLTLPVTVTAKPAAPALTLVPMDQALQVIWTAVPDATGYLIYFSTSAFDASSLPADPVEVGGAAVSHRFSGLVNGKTYFVAVKARAQARIFAAVTAVLDGALPPGPGSANESHLSQETSLGFGEIVESDLSNRRDDFPESVTPFPNLKGEGCFIATAAYGFYSAPQVQVLREFRDRYLLPHDAGRAFVAWYYRHGPSGARFLDAHPWLKPPVRLALFPLVAGAYLLIHTPAAAGIALALLALMASGILQQRIRRKPPVHFGGTH